MQKVLKGDTGWVRNASPLHYDQYDRCHRVVFQIVTLALRSNSKVGLQTLAEAVSAALLEDGRKDGVHLQHLEPYLDVTNNNVVTLYLRLAWQWAHLGARDHATSLLMRHPRGRKESVSSLVMAVSAKRIHKRRMSYGFRSPAPASWEDFNADACNSIAELWMANMFRQERRGLALLHAVYRARLKSHRLGFSLLKSSANSARLRRAAHKPRRMAVGSIS